MSESHHRVGDVTEIRDASGKVVRKLKHRTNSYRRSRAATRDQQLGYMAHQVLMSMSTGSGVKLDLLDGTVQEGRVVRLLKDVPLAPDKTGSTLRFLLADGQVVALNDVKEVTV